MALTQAARRAHSAALAYGSADSGTRRDTNPRSNSV